MAEAAAVRARPHRTARQAAKQMAALEAFALGHLAERYPDLDEIVDMLVLVTRGTRLVRTER